MTLGAAMTKAERREEWRDLPGNLCRPNGPSDYGIGEVPEKVK